MAVKIFKNGKLVKVAGNYGKKPDNFLSDTSENAVQNKAVAQKFNEIETKGYLSFATMERTTTLRGAEEFIFGEYDFESTGKPAMFEGLVPVSQMTGAIIFSFYIDGVLQDSFQFFNMTGQFKFNQQKTLTKGTHRIKFTSRSASSADTYKLGQWSVALFRVIEL